MKDGMRQVTWTRSGDVLIARAEGRIYSSEFMEWQTLLEEGIRPGDNRMVVNLAQVHYMSSAGLQILINLARRFSGPEQCFAIGGTGRLTRKVIQASGFEEMLRVRDTEAAALVTVRTAHLEDED